MMPSSFPPPSVATFALTPNGMSKRRAITEVHRSLQTEYSSSRYRECIVENHAWVVSLSRDGCLDETIFSQLYRSFADGLRLVASFKYAACPPSAARRAYSSTSLPGEAVQPIRSSNGTDTPPGASQSRLIVARQHLSPKDDRPQPNPPAPIVHPNAETQVAMEVGDIA